MRRPRPPAMPVMRTFSPGSAPRRVRRTSAPAAGAKWKSCSGPSTGERAMKSRIIDRIPTERQPGGTHLDAPIHFAEGRWTADEIPLDRLVGPALVVDVGEKAARDPDALLTRADLEAFEGRGGRIPDGAVVLVRTGWDRFWDDRARYLGSAAPGDTAHLHFPGVGEDAALWLTTVRRIRSIGIDTASIDHGPSRDFRAHRALTNANVPIFENLAGLAALPPRGAVFIGLPMKIRGGSGGPLRAVAVLP